jgi:hypothetical protein
MPFGWCIPRPPMTQKGRCKPKLLTSFVFVNHLRISMVRERARTTDAPYFGHAHLAPTLLVEWVICFPMCDLLPSRDHGDHGPPARRTLPLPTVLVRQPHRENALRLE